MVQPRRIANGSFPLLCPCLACAAEFYLLRLKRRSVLLFF
jgi:hypothetical protein